MLRACLLVGLLFGTQVWAKPTDGQDVAATHQINCELRLVWGGPAARVFDGLVSVKGGTIRLVRNLSIQPNSVGTIRSKNSTTLEVLPHSRNTFGGADILILGSLDTVLSLAFNDPYTQKTVEHTVRVGDVLNGNWLEQLDERGAKIAIERQVHDRIRFRSSKSHYVLDTSTSWDATVNGNRTGLTAGEYQLHVQIANDQAPPTDVMDQTVTVDSNGNFEPVQLEVTTPAVEGVYQLEIRLYNRRFLNSILRSSPVITRRVEFVAFDPDGTRTVIDDWTPLVFIDALRASKPGMLAWLSPMGRGSPLSLPKRWKQYNPLSGSLTRPISHGSMDSRIVKTQGSVDRAEQTLECLRLGSDAWLAIPLGDLQAGHPHRLRVRTPVDQPLSLVVSLKHSNSRGTSPTMGNDHRIRITRRECVAGGELATHELLFWPSSGESYLILANMDDQQTASVLDVEIHRAELHADVIDFAEETAAQASKKNATERMVGIYLDKPLLSECFNVDREIDSQTGRALESWSTWQTACTRLSQYLQWSDSNLLIMKVHADGGAIFPSQHLQPTVRYDSGVFFSDGRSPKIKDAVELLLRHCQRNGIRLILALDLDSALQDLVDTDAQSGRAIEPVFQQQLLQSPERTSSKRYDPLNPRVQSEIQSAVREVVSRYGGHSAFAGIQLQMDRKSQLVFRGDKWGYSERSLGEFERSTKATLPPKDQLDKAFSGSLRFAFLSWRAAELSELLESLGRVVARSGPDRKLYLNATRLWDENPDERDFYNPANIILNPTEYMLAFGIDAPRIRQLRDVVLMQGKFQRPSRAMKANDWIRQVAQQQGLKQTSGERSAASALLIQQPDQYTLSDFTGIVGPNVSGTLYPLTVKSRHAARRELVELVFESDAQLLASGAWLPLANQSGIVAQLRRTLRDFPPIAMSDVSLQQKESNVRIRIGRLAGQTVVQLINNAPWEEDIAMAMRFSVVSPAIRILGNRQIELQRADDLGRSQTRNETWHLKISPYDVIGIEVSDPEMKLLDVVHAPSEVLLTQIATDLAEIEEAIAKAADPTQQAPLADIAGDFERWVAANQVNSNQQASAQRPAGWNVSSLPGVAISASTDLPHSGRKSLLIENANRGDVSAWIQSAPITPPGTGRLAVQAWLRVPATNSDLVVRFSVVGHTRFGRRFERSKQFGANNPQFQLSNDWGTRPAKLFVSDIPAAELDEIFVSIELLGSGKVWVDDVKVLQADLHPDERILLQGKMFVAKQKLAEGNPYPAERLLDSHWGRYLAQLRPSGEYESNGVRPNDTALSEQHDMAEPKSSWNNSQTLFHQLRESMRERWRR